MKPEEQNNVERRNLPVEIEYRQEGDEPARLVGRAAVFNQESEDLGGFVEVIEPGFFREVLNGDTRSLWNHNSDFVLGRTTAGTLRLEEDEQGLGTEINPPDTTWARDAMVSVKRRDVSQMSFGFKVRKGGDEWYERDDGVVVRILKAGGCERLYDVSPVTFPAYPVTTVEARDMAKQIAGQPTPPNGGATGGGADDQRAVGRLAVMRRRLELAEKM